MPEESEFFYCSLSISQTSEGVVQVNASEAIVIIEDNDGKYSYLHALTYVLSYCYVPSVLCYMYIQV